MRLFDETAPQTELIPNFLRRFVVGLSPSEDIGAPRTCKRNGGAKAKEIIADLPPLELRGPLVECFAG